MGHLGGESGTEDGGAGGKAKSHWGWERRQKDKLDGSRGRGGNGGTGESRKGQAGMGVCGGKSGICGEREELCGILGG